MIAYLLLLFLVPAAWHAGVARGFGKPVDACVGCGVMWPWTFGVWVRDKVRDWKEERSLAQMARPTIPMSEDDIQSISVALRAPIQ